MKKKNLIIAVSLVLIAVMSAGATLAYFSAKTEPVTNMFTLGNISASISEPNWNPNPDRVMVPGDSYLKDPTITIGASSQPAWVFIKVTVSDAAALLAAVGEGALLPEIASDLASGWTLMTSPAVAGDTATYVYGYDKIVGAGASTSPIFTEITLPTSVDGSNTYASLTDGFTIAAQGFAVQAAYVDTLAAAYALAQTQFDEI